MKNLFDAWAIGLGYGVSFGLGTLFTGALLVYGVGKLFRGCKNAYEYLMFIHWSAKRRKGRK